MQEKITHVISAKCLPQPSPNSLQVGIADFVKRTFAIHVSRTLTPGGTENGKNVTSLYPRMWTRDINF